MARIGVRDLYYAKITEDADGIETYAAPVRLAKAITINLSVELTDATLYADDGVDVAIKEFVGGTLDLTVNDIGTEKAADLTGAEIDENGVLVSASDDMAPRFAIGFRSKGTDGGFKYFWLYRAQFGVGSENYQTKGENITFGTPTISGAIMRRNKPDAKGKNPWRAVANSADPAVPKAIIDGWFDEVYEPEYEVAP